MNKGVEILLERMKSNPDEFVPEIQYGTSKWAGIINAYSQYLTEEENKAINEAYVETTKKVMQERFTAKVMEELLTPKETSTGHNDVNPLKAYYAGTGVGGGGGGSYAAPGVTGGGGGGSSGFTLTTNNNGSPMWVSGQQASSVLDAQTQSYQMQIQLEHQRELMKMQAKEAQKAKKISMLERLIGK